MKCVAGIYGADAGEIWLRGRMAPFIELGVGFNPELSARDNVQHQRDHVRSPPPTEARARFDGIIDFAELREFQDLKLKNYSSGMQVRLAFAVMVHVDADLLLIDEVLAVGDAAFQQKCYDVLTTCARAGRTILLVTHDMDQVQRFATGRCCSSAASVVAIGGAREVARRYTELNFAPQSELTEATRRAGAGAVGAATIIEPGRRPARASRTETLEQGISVAMCMRVRFLAEAVDPVFVLTPPRRVRPPDFARPRRSGTSPGPARSSPASCSTSR